MFDEQDEDPKPFKKKEVCGNCGRGFGLMSYEYWPHRVCSMKCYEELRKKLDHKKDADA